MADIVERLRDQSGWRERSEYMWRTGELLWDAIEEIERLRAALRDLADSYYENYDRGQDERYSPNEESAYRAAVALLNEQKGEEK